jgi:hypothetical protein
MSTVAILHTDIHTLTRCCEFTSKMPARSSNRCTLYRPTTGPTNLFSLPLEIRAIILAHCIGNVTVELYRDEKPARSRQKPQYWYQLAFVESRGGVDPKPVALLQTNSQLRQAFLHVHAVKGPPLTIIETLSTLPKDDSSIISRCIPAVYASKLQKLTIPPSEINFQTLKNIFPALKHVRFTIIFGLLDLHDDPCEDHMTAKLYITCEARWLAQYFVQGQMGQKWLFSAAKDAGLDLKVQLTWRLDYLYSYEKSAVSDIWVSDPIVCSCENPTDMTQTVYIDRPASKADKLPVVITRLYEHRLR